MEPSGTLVVTDLPGDDPAGARLVWARSHDVVLLLGDGRAVSVDSIAGYHGAEAPAPAMDEPPLTVEQAVDLARGLERMVREGRAH
ncbi:hypothetical protein [Kitasatospora sp. NPDC085879]|uniref:hypothetical protein n=1 Tax=Kitasatospora sp. NPDC085879 TaxID=3154769 RepID=UPI00342C36E9